MTTLIGHGFATGIAVGSSSHDGFATGIAVGSSHDGFATGIAVGSYRDKASDNAFVSSHIISSGLAIGSGLRPEQGFATAAPSVTIGSQTRSGCNNIIVGKSDIGSSTDNCSAFGSDNYIPDGAHDCHIIGSGIKLTPGDVINNVVYFSGRPFCAVDCCGWWPSAFEKIEERLSNITGKPFIYQGEYFDIIERLQFLEKKVKELEPMHTTTITVPWKP